MNKIELLLNVMEAPGQYSMTEIEELLHEPEVKEIFDLLDKTKSSLKPIQTPNIDEEWEYFKNRNRNPLRRALIKLSRFSSLKAAAIITITIVSVTAFAAIISINIGSFNAEKNEAATTPATNGDNISLNRQNVITVPANSEEQASDIIIFDNESLDVIMTVIGDFYGYKILFNKISSKTLRLYYRWNQASTIEDIAENLNNFEQIHLTIEGDIIKID